jgi:hypothetical protein
VFVCVLEPVFDGVEAGSLFEQAASVPTIMRTASRRLKIFFIVFCISFA